MEETDDDDKTEGCYEKFGHEDYEIRGAKKIQHVLKEARNIELDFKSACRLWQKFSDEEYCAGWMSMEAFADLDEKIIFAYDNYGEKISLR